MKVFSVQYSDNLAVQCAMSKTVFGVYTTLKCKQHLHCYLNIANEQI